MLNKNWGLTKEKYYEHILNDRYYDCLPLRPGTEFFRLFTDAQVPLKIKINIPHTIGLFDEKYYLKTNEEGYITWTNIFKENHVFEVITKIAEIDYGKETDADLPAAIFKQQQYNEVSNWESFKDDMGSNKLRSGGIMQQYIYPFGGKAWIVRFVYFYF